jgi:biopolymer transport protein ExbB
MLGKRSVVWGLVAMMVVFLFVGATWAQDKAAAAPQAAKSWSMWNAFMSGGFIFFTIVILSIIAVALIIEHFVTINDEKLIPQEFVAQLQQLMTEKKYKDAMALCNASDNYISRVMAAGIAEIPYGYEKMVEAMVTISEEEAVKLHQKIGYLSLIGVTGPMMGLLGTVYGMMKCFNTVASSTHGTQAKDLAEGISMKLVCTFGGLVVALPCMFFFNFFQDRVTNIGLEAGAVCEELIRRFKPVKVQVAGFNPNEPAAPQAPQAPRA